MVRKAWLSFLCLLMMPHLALADLLFEGYAKIKSGDDHIGYVISRYEFDSKKNQFISTYFLKTGKGGGEITESLKAFADSKLAPISYEYTTMVGKDIKTIDAKFKNGNLSAVVKEHGKIQRIEKKIPKGTFLSTFLVYLMLKSNEGLQTDKNYDYQAIAEEDAGIHKGKALVGKEEMFNGFKVFKVLNTFKDNKFVSYVNERGEVLGTDAQGIGITTELVENPADATANQALSPALLKTLFGGTPLGQANALYRSKKLKEAQSQAGEPTKQMGVPPGQGIMIKNQSPAPQPPSSESKGQNR